MPDTAPTEPADHGSGSGSPEAGAGVLLNEHPEPLITADGFAVVCANCRAVQDWLLIHYCGDTWIRCRCAHGWLAPDNLDTSDEGAEQPEPDRNWPTLDHAVTALGFDGLLARTRWNP